MALGLGGTLTNALPAPPAAAASPPSPFGEAPPSVAEVSYDPMDEGPEEVDFDGGFDASSTTRPGRSILGSMGSFLWIAMLIAFSLSSRMCGE